MPATDSVAPQQSRQIAASINTNFFNGLISIGKKVYLASLNEYSTYKKADSLIIFTATYGDGEAPENADKFLEDVEQIKPPFPQKVEVLRKHPAYTGPRQRNPREIFELSKAPKQLAPASIGTRPAGCRRRDEHHPRSQP